MHLDLARLNCVAAWVSSDLTSKSDMADVCGHVAEGPRLWDVFAQPGPEADARRWPTVATISMVSGHNLTSQEPRYQEPQHLF